MSDTAIEESRAYRSTQVACDALVVAPGAVVAVVKPLNKSFAPSKIISACPGKNCKLLALFFDGQFQSGPFLPGVDGKGVDLTEYALERLGNGIEPVKAEREIVAWFYNAGTAHARLSIHLFGECR